MILETSREELYVDEIINRILFNLELTQCKIQWIPSHVGINGNEKADKLAKEGTKQQSTIKNKIRVSDAISAFQIKAQTKANRWYTLMSTTKGEKI